VRGKNTFITLTEAQRQALKEGHLNGKKGRYRRRCQMLLLNNKGKTVSQISALSALLEVSRQTIHTCFKLYVDSGIAGLQRNKGGGRPPIIKITNPAEIKRIKEIVADHPQQLKCALPVIKREFGIESSKQTLIRFIKKNDCTYKRLRSVTGK
jgi:transposase